MFCTFAVPKRVPGSTRQALSESLCEKPTLDIASGCSEIFRNPKHPSLLHLQDKGLCFGIVCESLNFRLAPRHFSCTSRIYYNTFYLVILGYSSECRLLICTVMFIFFHSLNLHTSVVLFQRISFERRFRGLARLKWLLSRPIGREREGSNDTRQATA